MTKFIKCKDNYKPTVIHSHDGIEYKKLPWKWRRKYKYELTQAHTMLLRDLPAGVQLKEHRSKYIVLTKNSHGEWWLTVKEGYRWDGVSGPTWDTDNTMRGGLIHDVLFQLMRGRVLAQNCFEWVNRLFRNILLEDDICMFRASYYFWAVQHFAHRYARPKGPDYTLTAGYVYPGEKPK